MLDSPAQQIHPPTYQALLLKKKKNRIKNVTSISIILFSWFCPLLALRFSSYSPKLTVTERASVFDTVKGYQERVSGVVWHIKTWKRSWNLGKSTDILRRQLRWKLEAKVNCVTDKFPESLGSVWKAMIEMQNFKIF